MVLDKHIEEINLKSEALRHKHAQMLAVERQNNKVENDAYFETVLKKAERDKKKILSKAYTAAQNILLVKKAKLIDELDLYLQDEIKKFISNGRYKKYFTQKFQEAMAQFPSSENMVIYLRAEDQRLINTANFQTETSENLLGGFYIIKDQKVKYDYTIDSVLAENQDFIGLLIHQLIEEAGDRIVCK